MHGDLCQELRQRPVSMSDGWTQTGAKACESLSACLPACLPARTHARTHAHRVNDLLGNVLYTANSVLGSDTMQRNIDSRAEWGERGRCNLFTFYCCSI